MSPPGVSQRDGNRSSDRAGDSIRVVSAPLLSCTVTETEQLNVYRATERLIDRLFSANVLHTMRQKTLING